MATTFQPMIGPAEPVKCDRYYTENNRTHFIYGGYEGIPENLLINFVVWLVSKIISYYKWHWQIQTGPTQRMPPVWYFYEVLSSISSFYTKIVLVKVHIQIWFDIKYSCLLIYSLVEVSLVQIH